MLEHGRWEAYTFFSRDPQAAHATLLEQRDGGGMGWWADEHPRTSYFRPLTSLSLWLDFEQRLPVWWMHLQNCVIYAVMVWLVVSLYKQFGLSDAGLGLASLFFALDGAIALSVGWIAARNTLLAACFGLACVLVHERARRTGRALLLALSSLLFALALCSGELGLCTLGYLAAHALVVDRSSWLRRALAVAPYGVIAGAYLANYVSAGYGNGGAGMGHDATTSPVAALLTWIESIPVWLATTATLPIATFQLIVPNFRWPLLFFSLVVVALLVRCIGSRSAQEPYARMLAIGAALSLVPLSATLPQERLRFLVSFGVYGLLGPWVARDFGAPARLPRMAARFVWRLHGVVLPLLFVPCLFSMVGGPGVAGALALDHELPRARAPIEILVNPPAWIVPWYQVAMRAVRDEVGPPVYSLYAGSQAVEIQRPDERSLELHVARSWFAAPFEALRDLKRSPFRVGDRIHLTAFDIEVREVNAAGAPTRARFTFARPLEDPGLVFRYWQGMKMMPWTLPPVGGSLQLAAAGGF